MAKGCIFLLLHTVLPTNNQQNFFKTPRVTNEARERKRSSICQFLYSSCSTDLVRVGSRAGNWHLCHPFLFPYFLSTVNLVNIHWWLSKENVKIHWQIVSIITRQKTRVTSSPRLELWYMFWKNREGSIFQRNWIN